jgi:DNA-damage-inducible protein D
MANKHAVNRHYQTFESIRQVDADGGEYWLARELQPLLEYTTWDKFRRVIEKAMEACRQSGHETDDHFSQAVKMVDIGSSAKREIEDVRLSRYACYLIVQNGDPTKPVIANGQTYFAMQARRQELQDNEAFARLSEDEKRLAIRNELSEHNKHLAAAAKDAGVETLRTTIITGTMAASRY